MLKALFPLLLLVLLKDQSLKGQEHLFICRSPRLIPVPHGFHTAGGDSGKKKKKQTQKHRGRSDSTAVKALALLRLIWFQSPPGVIPENH